jgi:hypothetical protein
VRLYPTETVRYLVPEAPPYCDDALVAEPLVQEMALDPELARLAVDPLNV